MVGSPSASTKISFNVVLPLRDAATADKLAADVSNPKSASYGHYLTAAQFNARFAPTNAQVTKVADFLRGAGISVTSTAQGNRWVEATGTVHQIESAFSTTLHNYRYKGHVMHAPSTSLSVPSSMAGLVTGVIGVTNDGALRSPDHVVSAAGGSVDSSTGPSDALPPPAQCSVFWDQHEQIGPEAYGRTSFPTPNCGYSASQIRTAYNVDSAVSHGNDGHGVTVAIIDAYASPTIVADANALSAMTGEPALAPGQYTQTTFTPFSMANRCGGEAGWNEEETLDVEAVHGMAPGANIHYIGAKNCDKGIDDAINFVIQNHVADIVSNSYGFAGEDGLNNEVTVEHSMFTQAAAEGIGFYFSSGDSGDNVPNGAPHPEPDFPASDPLVTAVGGTDLAVTSSNQYLFETSWGDTLSSVNTTTSPSSYSPPPPGDFIFGGGGGVSALFAEPSYQAGVVPDDLARLNGGDAMRVVPDVGALGDPETGFLIIFNGTPVQIGGTSLSCPIFAGIQADASQDRSFPIGFANPLLYSNGAAGRAFRDVTAPSSTLAMMTVSGRSLLTMGMDTSLTATPGYDDTTGLGTPNGPGLLRLEKVLP
jgi:subtilase family serine protease